MLHIHTNQYRFLIFQRLYKVFRSFRESFNKTRDSSSPENKTINFEYDLNFINFDSQSLDGAREKTQKIQTFRLFSIFSASFS